MSTLDTLTKTLFSSEAIDTLSKKTDTSSSDVKKVLKNAVPYLISTLQDNAEDEDGATSLLKALADHADDDNSVKDTDIDDGMKILEHILGSNTSKLSSGISKKTDLSSKKILTILAAVAPILLSLIGKETKKKKTKSNDLSSLIGSLFSNSSGKKSSKIDIMDLAGSFFGGDDDSNLDDIMDLANLFLKKNK